MIDNKTIELFQTLRILYVEDDDFSRNSVIETLDKIFLEVASAQNGAEGLDIFTQLQQHTPVDLILSDINMPIKSGLEMVQDIRQTDKDIPIIFLTAYNDNDYLLKALNLQISDYVLKPLDFKQLFEKMRQAYIPVQQKKLLEQKNIELEALNQKIKKIAKQEFAKFHNSIVESPLHAEDEIILNFNTLIDNLKS